MRDLWLHIHSCALTWTEPDSDILALVLQRAITAAPGLTPKEVGRMMGPTIRRGLAAVAGQPRTCDPRYDYASDRLCDLLSVDRRLATDLGFRQLLPADLRAERNRQRRTERRRAAGVLPRAIWLAAHPISRLKPWEAEGVSRATWYRRQAEARRRRLQACLGQLMAGSAGACALRETGPVPLYKGEAPAPLGMAPTIGLDSSSALADSHPNPEATKKTKRAGQPRCVMAAPAPFAGAGA
jgi:hypothetical protein